MNKKIMILLVGIFLFFSSNLQAQETWQELQGHCENRSFGGPAMTDQQQSQYCSCIFTQVKATAEQDSRLQSEPEKEALFLYLKALYAPDSAISAEERQAGLRFEATSQAIGEIHVLVENLGLSCFPVPVSFE